jgi:hypothetical protein
MLMLASRLVRWRCGFEGHLESRALLLNACRARHGLSRLREVRTVWRARHRLQLMSGNRGGRRGQRDVRGEAWTYLREGSWDEIWPEFETAEPEQTLDQAELGCAALWNALPKAFFSTRCRQSRATPDWSPAAWRRNSSASRRAESRGDRCRCGSGRRAPGHGLPVAGRWWCPLPPTRRAPGGSRTRRDPDSTPGSSTGSTSATACSADPLCHGLWQDLYAALTVGAMRRRHR